MPRFVLAKSWVPKHIFDTLNKEFRYFMWGKEDSSNKMWLFTWESIYMPCKDGVSGVAS